VFIALVKNEQGRADEALRILEDAAAGKLEIVTSAWTLAEVIKTPGEPPLSPQVESKIMDFFENEYVLIVNLDRKVAEEARQISRDYGPKPKDAVHLATAKVARLDLLETWDDQLLRLTDKIGDPAICIRRPTWEGQLPFGSATG